MPTPEEDIEAVLNESGPEYDSFSFERPTAGHQGEVFFVTLGVGGEEYEIVVKFKSGDTNFALEPFLHDFVADRTEVPVPRILVFNESPDLDVEPYFVTERIRGNNLAEALGSLDPATREKVLKHVGQTLGDMHSGIQFEGFGRLALEEERLIVDEFSWDWGQLFSDITDAYIDRLSETPFSDLQERARAALRGSTEYIESTGPPLLVHDDYRPANMLFDPDEAEPITAVLDWQFALAGEAEYHLARTEFLFIDPSYQDAETRTRLREHLYEGYRNHCEFEVDDAFERRRPIYYFSTLIWRMLGFDAAFGDVSELAQSRAEVQYRQQFDQLVGRLPGDGE